MGGNADRGDSVRLEAFSDGVLAIAITLLILDVRVEQQPGESLAAALGHAGPEVGAYAASFLQIGIMWANHHALFRIVDRVDQLLLLANLLLLGFVAFLPLPTRLVAQHTSGGDARTAMLLYGATLTGCALAFNLIWRHTARRGLLVDGVDPGSSATSTSATWPVSAATSPPPCLPSSNPGSPWPSPPCSRSCSSSGHRPAPPRIDRSRGQRPTDVPQADPACGRAVRRQACPAV
ncbi:MAG: TMEM175 family protein [Nocardioidaceae bacterium]